MKTTSVPYLRNNSYYIRRRVPLRYQTVEPRKIVHICLNTDSLAHAEIKAKMVWEQMIEAWEDRLDGNRPAGDARMATAMKIAARRGYRFVQVDEVATLPIEDLLHRVDRQCSPRDGADRKSVV